MKTLKQKLKDILAQAGKVRVDVVLARVAVITGGLAAIAPWTGLIPGKTGAAIAGLCAIAAGLTPRIQHAAGLLSPVYAGQTPFLKVLPELVKTLLSAPQIVAQAKADAHAAEAAQKSAQADQDKAAMVDEVAAKVADLLIKSNQTGSFAPGTLSRDVPASLSQDLSQDAPELQAPVPALTSIATVHD